MKGTNIGFLNPTWKDEVIREDETQFDVRPDETSELAMLWWEFCKDEGIITYVEEVEVDELTAFEPCMDTVNFWIGEFKGNIDEEIEEVNGTISNERLWLMGSSSQEEIAGHNQNIADLAAYLEWLESEERKGYRYE